MKYLITGGGGFIGSNLLNRLNQEGHEIAVIGHSIKEINLKPGISFYNIDIGSAEMRKIFEKEKPEIVCHLAGPINLRRPINDVNFNKSCTFFSDFKNILDYSKDLGIKKLVIVTSGGAIYADSEVVPTTEKCLVCPSSLYGMANLMMEKLLEDYNKHYGIDFVVLRLSNVYGPEQWKIGETKSFVIPSVIENIYRKEPLEVSGDGKQTRDFIYIDDVIEALIIASRTKKNGIFNIGSGIEISLNELFSKIGKIANAKSKIIYNNSLNVGARKSALDISKSKNDLSWEPSLSLEDGLRKTIIWYKLKYGK